MEEKTYTYETKSLDTLATLLALGAEVTKIDKETDQRFFTFYLESKTVDLEKQALALASKTLVVNAYELLDAYRRSKSIIHSNVKKRLD